ncbi:hypothetical protein V5O48_002583 [Marasmius crinis-equi]|uniref:FAD-binding PCMH-type domain-containing protein n=1 Tax=Marasmius crinis-equi TaxID=585013 RepID=A0ABR3FVL7_9AGAR
MGLYSILVDHYDAAAPGFTYVFNQKAAYKKAGKSPQNVVRPPQLAMFGPSYLTLVATSVLSFTSSSAGQDANCKCLYGDACWPSDSAFEQLSTQLSQPLVHPIPPAAACYPTSNPLGNCTDAQANSTNGNWLADQAGAYQNTNFGAYISTNGTVSTCSFNVTLGLPCEQGSVPPIGVDARTVEDIQTAVRFASEHNLRLVVKNTGHDYLGRSAGRSGFMIWTHHLKNITYSESFTPEGASADETYKALTIAAGVQWHEAYSAAQQNNRYVLGGISQDGSVGAAGGWIGGGGHSAFALKYGLGVDNAIQFTVVTANGDHVTANGNSNSDLFWALRGGGPGTYGVVTSVTFKTHDIEPLMVAGINANFTSPEIARSVGTEFFRLQPKVADAQWGGYSWFNEANFMYLLLATNASAEQLNATVGSFVQHLTSTAGENNTRVAMFPSPSFYDVFGQFSGTGIGSQVGHNVELASRLFTKSLYETQPEKMADTFLGIPGGIAINHVAGGVVSEIDPDSVGLNPAWRDTLGLVYTSVGWPDGASAAEIQAQREILKGHISILEGLEPGTGSYVNEGSMYEPNPQHTYFGSHYEKLLSIKDQYDPKELFVVNSGVGSERWDDQLVCRKTD